MADTLSRLRELDTERFQLLENAKREVLERAEAAISELRELGFEYQLVEGGGKTRKPKGGSRSVSAAACPVCRFRTEPPHDARTHRSQGDNKRPFTAKQLSELGLEKVGDADAGDEGPKRGRKPMGRRKSKQQNASE